MATNGPHSRKPPVVRRPVCFIPDQRCFVDILKGPIVDEGGSWRVEDINVVAALGDQSRPVLPWLPCLHFSHRCPVESLLMVLTSGLCDRGHGRRLHHNPSATKYSSGETYGIPSASRCCYRVIVFPVSGSRVYGVYELLPHEWQELHTFMLVVVCVVVCA